MSWIKENKFVAMLGGTTLLGALVLFFVGLAGSGKYEKAKAAFDESAAEVEQFEKLPLYPKAENRDGKKKALATYRQQVDGLQKKFDTFRPKEIVNISPQDFTTRLKTANDEVRKAFQETGGTVPDEFFLGFEAYTDTLARESATGVLDYQLSSIKDLLLALAASSPAQLKNVHRPRLPEEEGQPYAPAATEVARELPLEITFTGSEESARKFITAVVKPSSRYAVIRTLRVSNEKAEPPRAEDAKFETKAAGGDSAAPAADPFAGGFVIPGEEPAAPAAAGGAPAATPAVPAGDASGRILAQVLGNENVQVFLRIDLLQFLPAKELPQP